MYYNQIFVPGGLTGVHVSCPLVSHMRQPGCHHPPLCSPVKSKKRQFKNATAWKRSSPLLFSECQHGYCFSVCVWGALSAALHRRIPGRAVKLALYLWSVGTDWQVNTEIIFPSLGRGTCLGPVLFCISLKSHVSVEWLVNLAFVPTLSGPSHNSHTSWFFSHYEPQQHPSSANLAHLPSNPTLTSAIPSLHPAIPMRSPQ